MRNTYVQNNQHTIYVPRRESRATYIQTLNNPHYKPQLYGYRSVYPVKSRPGKKVKRSHIQGWVAHVTILSLPEFPVVRPSVREGFHNYLRVLKTSCQQHEVSFRKMFRKSFSDTSKDVFQKAQLKSFNQDFPMHTLSQFRKSWYHDCLLHRMSDPYMRIIRKCRLGVSELRDHSWFHTPERSKKCPHCHTQQNETLEHFFLHCPTFTVQRNHYLNAITPILRGLNLPITVGSFLGFDSNLEHKNYSSQQLSLRRRLYTHTCEFLRLTQRFQFV